MHARSLVQQRLRWCQPCSPPVQRTVSPSAVVLVLAALAASLQCSTALTTIPTVHTDHTMGIRIYSFLVPTQEAEGACEMRVYLRAHCEDGGKRVLVRGFAGIFVINGSATPDVSRTPHFMPPSVHRRRLFVVSAAAAANRSTELKWYGPSSHGFWRLEGKVEPAGGQLLTLEGSEQAHQLALDCEGSMVALGPAQQTPLPQEGLLNVVTTTSANRLEAETLAYLLLLHIQYHERLGFNGTILRCNKGEAQELAVLPHVEALVQANKLIIWPWVHEHSTGETPYLWQKPRNQLTLLAAFGTKVQLAFFDLDEYLVLPQGGSVQHSTCMGAPLLGASPAMSWTRFSARSCRHKVADLACWKEGRAVPAVSGVSLEMERCPCQFHKPLVQPDKILTMSVHFVWAWGAAVFDVPPTCGFLLHFSALIEARGHFNPQLLAPEHRLRAEWSLPAAGSGQALVPGTSHSIAHVLLNATHCNELRKAAGEHVTKYFSWC